MQLWRVLLQSIEAKSRQGALLDVGAGLGFFVKAARERGWDASGVELSAWACDFARGNLQVPMLTGELDDVRGTFDVLTMWSFLEHTLDPVAALAFGSPALAPRRADIRRRSQPALGRCAAAWSRGFVLQARSSLLLRSAVAAIGPARSRLRDGTPAGFLGWLQPQPRV